VIKEHNTIYFALHEINNVYIMAQINGWLNKSLTLKIYIYIYIYIYLCRDELFIKILWMCPTR
jgi:hypothetical protein